MKGASLTAAATAFILAACADTYLDGAIQTRDQAIAVADRECGSTVKYYPGPWHTRLNRDTWSVWRGHGGMQITIDASDGKTSGCVIVTS